MAELSRVDHIVIQAGTGSTTYVTAAEYGAVVTERDNLRRQLALINAWRLHYVDAIEHDAAMALHRLLTAVGETPEIGQAVRDIAASLGVERPVWVGSA